jgi:hypothetical protein
MPQGIEDVRIITHRERNYRYSGEGEKQERGGYGVALSCVISRFRGEGELTFRSRLRR